MLDAILVLLASLAGLFAIPLLIFSILTGIGILAIDVVTGMRGLPTSMSVDLFIAAIIVVSLILGVLYVREVK